jgi:hypothetical protein
MISFEWSTQKIRQTDRNLLLAGHALLREVCRGPTGSGRNPSIHGNRSRERQPLKCQNIRMMPASHPQHHSRYQQQQRRGGRESKQAAEHPPHLIASTWESVLMGRVLDEPRRSSPSGAEVGGGHNQSPAQPSLCICLTPKLPANVPPTRAPYSGRKGGPDRLHLRITHAMKTAK